MARCIRLLLVLSVLVPGGALAQSADSITTPPTHTDFVRTALEVTAQNAFADFPYRRGKPLWIMADGNRPDAAGWFEAATTRELYDRGMLVRQPRAPGSIVGDGSWLLRYQFSECRLELTDPTRYSFLGRIWLRRSFTVGLAVSLWDVDNDELLWTNSADSTFRDWIPKRFLPALADTSVAFLSPDAPTTAWERAVRPGLGATAAVGALTALFLIIR